MKNLFSYLKRLKQLFKKGCDYLLHKIIQRGIDEQYYAGGICNIWEDGKDYETIALGWANKDREIPMDRSKLFDLASLTKLYTATLVLHHISNKRLSLDDRLGDFKIGPPVIGNVKVRELLLHTSGITSWYPFYNDNQYGKSFEMILNDIDVTKDAKRNEVTYSDLNFMLLRFICECIDARTFEQQIQFILNEIGDDDGGFLLNRPKSEFAATEYGNQIEHEMCKERGLTFSNWRSPEQPIVGHVNDGNAYYFFEGVSGHAGLFGSYKTVSKLGQLYIKGGGSLLDAELVEFLLELNENERTLGFSKSGLFMNGLGHTGFTGTMLYIEPKTKRVITFLANRLHVENPKDMYEIRNEVIHYVR